MAVSSISDTRLCSPQPGQLCLRMHPRPCHNHSHVHCRRQGCATAVAEKNNYDHLRPKIARKKDTSELDIALETYSLDRTEIIPVGSRQRWAIKRSGARVYKAGRLVDLRSALPGLTRLAFKSNWSARGHPQRRPKSRYHYHSCKFVRCNIFNDKK